MTVGLRLNAAVAAASRGDIATARREAEAALRERPNSPVVLQVLGVLCCQAGAPELGARHLRKAISLGADTVDNRFNLARALVDAGDLAGAEAVCALPEGRDTPIELQRLRADILKRLDRRAEAIAIYDQIVWDRPDDFEAWNNLGNAKHESGDIEGGITALARARSLSPETALIHINLGRAFLSADRFEDSLTSFSEAARLAPNDPVALLEYGRALERMGLSAEALAPLGTAARLDRGNPEVFTALGLTFTSLENVEQAERAFQIALQIDSKSAAAFLNLAILLEKNNRVEDLARLISSASAAGIAGDEMSFAKAMQHRRAGEFREALTLSQLAYPESLDPAIRAQFVGEVADRLGEYDTAFMAFEDMNRYTATTPEAMRFDGSEHRRYVEALTQQATAEWIRSWTPVSVDTTRPAPAFLVGFLRSGTTLLDTILMGHSQASVLEEEPYLARVEEMAGEPSQLGNLDHDAVADLRAAYFRQVDTKLPPRGGELIVDKNPLGSLRSPLIHRLFPDARFIFALRHPCDVVLSCFMQNLRINQAMASFLDLRNAALLYDRVMTYWERCREILPLKVHAIRYEDLVVDVEGEIRPLLDFLGLEWESSVLDHQSVAAQRGHIRTPSYAQVMEPIYTRSSGRWTRYRHHMEHILPILAPWAQRYGYTIE